MTALLAGSILVLLLDQMVKLLVLRRLRHASISLGPMGSVRSVQTQMWMVRAPYKPKSGGMWILWILAACLLTVVDMFVPSSGVFCALLLGGSLSHVLETSVRGSICDYVCLRFWPAFNLADIAITVGAIGVGIQLVMAMAHGGA